MDLTAKNIYELIKNRPHRDGEYLINQLIKNKVSSTKISLIRSLIEVHDNHSLSGYDWEESLFKEIYLTFCERINDEMATSNKRKQKGNSNEG